MGNKADKAVEVIETYGMFDGSHHKQWVLDQAMRALLGKKGYKKWLKEFNSDDDYEDWDKGIAP